ncbi:MAG: zinc-ribbon domain-containing protein [Nitrososphaerota archaeon]|nr:zinc-ribbon domain-containing protein [Nitrososphaerota archaeon]
MSPIPAKKSSDRLILTIGRDAAESGGPTYCENCGQPNASSAIYCVRCGHPLNMPE